MPPDVAERILQTRLSATNERNVAWLLRNNVVNLSTFKRILPFVTAQGNVFRAQIVAFVSPRGPVKRAEVVIDGTRRPARQVYWKELTGLGAGFNLRLLGAGGDEELFGADTATGSTGFGLSSPTEGW